MKSHPLKQDAKFMTTAYDKNIQGLTKEQRNIFRSSQAKAAGVAASLLPIGRGIKLGAGLLSGGFFGGRGAGQIINFGIKNRAKYPSYLPKGWNKGGSKKAFEHLINPKTPMGPTKETVNSILNYSKDFGPILKNMKK